MFIHRLNTAIFLRAGTLAITAAALTSATSVSAMSAEEARAETQRIALQYEQTMAHCRTLQGNMREICEEDAKGSRRVAQAERDLKLQGGAEHEYQVRLARAQADYRVAHERCNDMRGEAVKVCKRDAEQAYLRAQQDARIRQVEAPPAVSTDSTLAPMQTPPQAPLDSAAPLLPPAR